MNPNRLRLLFSRGLLLLACLWLSACATSGGTRGPLGQALYEYAGAIRWSEFEVAWTYVDPEVRLEQPLTSLELERFKQVQVADYQVKRVLSQDKERYEQLVEVRLINKHTQTERIVSDRQLWRFDPTLKQWWLVSGLPKITND